MSGTATTSVAEATETETRTPHERGALTLGALGVVFGDIGTNPLYSVKTVFTVDGGVVQANPVDVYGVTSCFFWVRALIVTPSSTSWWSCRRITTARAVCSPWPH